VSRNGAAHLRNFDHRTSRRIGWLVLATIAALFVAAGPAHAVAVADTVAQSTTHLLTWWKAIVLGIVEGFTEYLPISSTGHLLITARLLDLPSAKGSAGLEAVNTYTIAIQFGAIVAVLGLFWPRFVEMFQGLLGRNPAGRHLLITLVIAFVPSAALGVALDKTIEDKLFGPWPVVLAWIVGGVLILVLERTGVLHDRDSRPVDGRDGLESITYRQALIIGIAQCVALWPGTSRSLASIVGALLVGVALPTAVEFSFLLGFATLTAATGYKLAKDGGTLVDQFGVVTPLLGAVFAALSAAVGIKWLVGYLRGHNLSIFAWYRFAVAAIAIVLLATSVI
jgi:undecaprenyl-diphosphatase